MAAHRRRPPATKSSFSQLHKKATGQAVTEFLVFQTENPNSIVSSICQARENARMVRDQITIEFWEELNRLYWFVRTPEARQVWKESPSEFFQQIKDSSLHLIGLGYATLLHNEGWWFVAGGKISRTGRQDLAHPRRALPEPCRRRACPRRPARPKPWSGRPFCARAAPGTPTKRFTARRCIRAVVVEFLLFNEDFPRSVRFCVGELNHALRRISGVPDGRFCNDAEKLAGRLVAELQFSTVDEIFDQGLHLYLDQLQAKLNDIGAALFDAYIFQSVPADVDRGGHRWSAAGGTTTTSRSQIRKPI